MRKEGAHLNNNNTTLQGETNYEKLKVVQEVLVEKELEATYLLNGEELTDYYFTEDKITFDNLVKVVENRFPNDTMVYDTEDLNEYRILKFTKSSESDKEYAIYIGDNGHPYISYAR